MPIGGGTFTVQNKILPGAYINFVSMGTNAKMGSRGVAALPLELNWGPDDKVFTMTATDFNATSSDDGLAVDDFSVNPAAPSASARPARCMKTRAGSNSGRWKLREGSSNR